MNGKWGVIVVDVQGDFTEWKKGSLAVPASGEDFVRAVEAATRHLKELGVLVFGTQDWHPPDHISFAVNHPGKRPFDIITIDGRRQVLWPPHCVQGTENARVLIDNNMFLAIIKKGQHPGFDSYSGFKDDGGVRTELDTLLRINSIRKLIIYGIATDYCVKATALDAVLSGYAVTLVIGLCRGVAADTTTAGVEEMERKGVRVVDTVEEIELN